MSGGARLEPEVGRFFLALGLMIMQGYGQTEAGPVISANPPDAIRIDTVGRVLQGVDLRLAEDGEILVRGDLVMEGYWGLPDATAAVIRDGWLHTGDIGALDDDGYLRITDRKKDMIVLSGGENVSPAKVEGMLMAEPEISQAVVAGDGRSSLTALVVPAQGYDDVGGGTGGNAGEPSFVGDRADTKARGGGAVHGGERTADADTEDPPNAGDAGECGAGGNHAQLMRGHWTACACGPWETFYFCPLVASRRMPCGRIRDCIVRSNGAGFFDQPHAVGLCGTPGSIAG